MNNTNRGKVPQCNPGISMEFGLASNFSFSFIQEAWGKANSLFPKKPKAVGGLHQLIFLYLYIRYALNLLAATFREAGIRLNKMVEQLGEYPKGLNHVVWCVAELLGGPYHVVWRRKVFPKPPYHVVWGKKVFPKPPYHMVWRKGVFPNLPYHVVWGVAEFPNALYHMVWGFGVLSKLNIKIIFNPNL